MSSSSSLPTELKQFFQRSPAICGPLNALKVLAGDVSSRRYYRTQSGVILTLYPSPFEDVSPGAEQALAYYQRRLAQTPTIPLTWANDPIAQVESTLTLHAAGIPVPEILAVDNELGVVALADLGDQTLQSAVKDASPETWNTWYREAVDLICALQGEGTTVANRRGSIPKRLALDGPKLAWEMDYFDNAVWKDALPKAVRGQAMQALKMLCHWLGSRPQVLCHRDYHGRNLMVTDKALGPESKAPSGPRLVIIDHQDARMGSRAYDLISLLQDPYLRPEPTLVGDMWDYYRSKRPDLGDEWDREVLGTSVQRLLKAAGTYGALIKKGRLDFAPLLRPTLEAALESLKSLGGYAPVQHALETHLSQILPWEA